MKVTQGDVEIIKKGHLEVQQKFNDILANGQSIWDYLYDQIETAGEGENINNREMQMKLLGELIYYDELATNATLENPDLDVYRVQGLEVQFCNQIMLDKHFIHVANMCIQEESFIQYLPINEAYDIDKDLIKKEMGIDFDATLDLDKQAEEEVIIDNENYVKSIISEDTEYEKYFELCSVSLVFDNKVFKGISQAVSDKKRELGKFTGNKTVDDMVTEFTSLNDQFDDVLTQVNSYDSVDVDAEKLVNKSKEIAAQKIGIYLAMKEKKDNRSTLDKLFHPIRSIKEHFAVKNMAEKLKVDYNLSDNNFDIISDTLKSNRAVEYMGLMKRDGNTISTLPTEEQIEAKKDQIIERSTENLEFEQKLSEDLTKDTNNEKAKVSEFNKVNTLENNIKIDDLN